MMDKNKIKEKFNEENKNKYKLDKIDIYESKILLEVNIEFIFLLLEKRVDLQKINDFDVLLFEINDIKALLDNEKSDKYGAIGDYIHGILEEENTSIDIYVFNTETIVEDKIFHKINWQDIEV